MRLKKSGIVAIFFLVSSCTGSEPSSPIETDFDKLKKAVLELRSPAFEIFQISEEDGAVRINLTFSSPPATGSELRRRTLNVLMEVQGLIGKAERVAVWVYQPNRKTVQGMAFFSPVSDQYHFKTAGEFH